MRNLVKLEKLRYLIEPISICSYFLLAFINTVLTEYIFQRYSDDIGYDFSFSTSSTSSNCGKVTNSTQFDLLQKVQKEASHMKVGVSLLLDLPAAITCLIYGPLSDKIGRKPLAVINSLGYVSFIVILLVIEYMQLSIKFIYLASLMIGLTGSYVSTSMVCFSYIADLYTEQRQKTVRLAVIEMLTLLGTTVSSFSSGVFLQRFGFLYSFYFMLALSLCSFVYALILKESLPKSERALPNLIDITKSPKKIYLMLTKARPERWKIWYLIFSSSLMFFGSANVYIGIIMLSMMNLPYCFPAKQIGYYIGTLLLTVAIGAVFCAKVLTKLLWNSVILMISALSAIGFLIALTFSKTREMLYLSLLVGIFQLAHPPVVKGMLSSIVHKEEIGSLFALCATMQALMGVVGTFTFQVLYVYMNSKNRSSQVYFFIALTCVVPLLLFIIYVIKEAKERSRNVSKELIFPESTEDENCNENSSLLNNEE